MRTIICAYRRPLQFLLLCVIGLTLTGCITSQNSGLAYDEAMETGQAQVGLQGLTANEPKVPQRDQLLVQLEKGRLAAAIADLKTSQQAFATARQLQEVADGKAARSVAGSAAEMLANPKVREYETTIADRIYMHFFPAVNALMMDDAESFRIHARAAAFAQQQIAAINQARILRMEAALAKANAEAQEKGNPDTNNAKLQSVITDNPQFKAQFALPENDYSLQLQARAPYESAMVHLVSGLGFALTAESAADVDDASKSLEFALQANPASKVAQHAASLLNAHGSNFAASNTVWIIHENGLGPKIEQFRVALKFQVPGGDMAMQNLVVGMMKADLVIPVPTSNELFSQALFSFPVIKPRPAERFYNGISVATATQRAGMELIASPQAQQMLDFQNHLNSKITGAIIGGVVKAAVAQIAINEAGNNPLLRLALGATVSGLTSADTRCWQTLPREFNAGFVPAPADGMLTISAASGALAIEPITVNVPADRSSIVYISTPGNATAPQIFISSFGEASADANAELAAASNL